MIGTSMKIPFLFILLLILQGLCVGALPAHADEPTSTKPASEAPQENPPAIAELPDIAARPPVNEDSPSPQTWPILDLGLCDN